MTPIDPQSNFRAAEKPEKVASTSPSPGKWTPTPESFEKLLAAFSSNGDEAARLYEQVRLKLLRYFERGGIAETDRYADITLDRVMRRIDGGEVIVNIMAFIYTVASFVRMEAWNDQKRAREAENEMKKHIEEEQKKETVECPRQLCLDRCMAKLPLETRWIREYYSEEGSAKIRIRRQIAKRLGIEMNALRIRAHRIRNGLETCVKNCVSQQV